MSASETVELVFRMRRRKDGHPYYVANPHTGVEVTVLNHVWQTYGGDDHRESAWTASGWFLEARVHGKMAFESDGETRRAMYESAQRWYAQWRADNADKLPPAPMNAKQRQIVITAARTLELCGRADLAEQLDQVVEESWVAG